MDVWRAELHRHAQSWADAAQLLPAVERAALEPVAQPHRDRRLAARVLQRTVLAHYLGVGPAEVHYSHGADGKPILAGDLASSGLESSPSTSDGCWLLAVSTAGAVGIDVEVVEPVPGADRIAARLLDPAEAAALARTGTDDDRLRGFLRLTVVVFDLDPTWPADP